MINIAIDGPSGAGKSTVAKEIAKRLNITYLDTGAMYRAFGLKALNMGIDPNDVDGVLSFLYKTVLEIKYEGGVQHVYLDGEDVSTAIREHKVSKAASDISKIKQVRETLVKEQQRIAGSNDVVLDGRDITTKVLPNSKNKFFLTASSDVRAKRRYDELISKGQTVDYETVLKDVIDRDYNDSHRAESPLTRTEDSVYIDSSDMTIEEVVQTIISNLK
ncbi:MAG: (d)CMP kinase [Clostridia bacterium]|nr:(d)CMP kinase [Clostridia bacterium]